MATLLDRANLISGNAFNAAYIDEPEMDDKALFPTSIARVGSPVGVGRIYTSGNGSNSYAWENVTVDSSGHVFIDVVTIGQPSAGYPQRPPVTLQLIGADDNFTLLALGDNAGGGYANYFLIGNKSFNPPNSTVTFPINDISTSGFANTPASLPPNDNALVGYPKCYVAGTNLLTEAGEIAVENIVPGMLLRVAGGGLRPVAWVGDAVVHVASQRDPSLAAPVRIRAGAIADAVPARDLMISPDHAIWTDGALVPAHMLVNGGSIVRELVSEAHYYHVELDQHDLVFAEGLTAESYLDDGRRTVFGGRDVSVLHQAFASGPDAYAERGFAPLALDEATVRPIWSRLAARAELLGMEAPLAASTNDPGFRVLADGVALAPQAVGAALRFAIPAGTGNVCLVSRNARPADARPWLDDRRRLGVMVGAIVIELDGVRHDIPMDDDAALTSGWWSVEANGTAAARWTDGYGVIAVPQAQGAVFIEVTLVGEMEYPVNLLAA